MKLDVAISDRQLKLMKMRQSLELQRSPGHLDPPPPPPPPKSTPAPPPPPPKSSPRPPAPPPVAPTGNCPSSNSSVSTGTRYSVNSPATATYVARTSQLPSPIAPPCPPATAALRAPMGSRSYNYGSATTQPNVPLPQRDGGNLYRRTSDIFPEVTSKVKPLPEQLQVSMLSSSSSSHPPFPLAVPRKLDSSFSQNSGNVSSMSGAMVTAPSIAASPNHESLSIPPPPSPPPPSRHSSEAIPTAAISGDSAPKISSNALPHPSNVQPLGFSNHPPALVPPRPPRPPPPPMYYPNAKTLADITERQTHLTSQPPPVSLFTPTESIFHNTIDSDRSVTHPRNTDSYVSNNNTNNVEANRDGLCDDSQTPSSSFTTTASSSSVSVFSSFEEQNSTASTVTPTPTLLSISPGNTDQLPPNNPVDSQSHTVPLQTNSAGSPPRILYKPENQRSADVSADDDFSIPFYATTSPPLLSLQQVGNYLSLASGNDEKTTHNFDENDNIGLAGAKTPPINNKSIEVRMQSELARVHQDKAEALRRVVDLEERLMEAKRTPPPSVLSAALEAVLHLAETEGGESSVLAWLRDQVATQSNNPEVKLPTGILTSLRQPQLVPPRPKRSIGQIPFECLRMATERVEHEYIADCATFVVRRPFSVADEGDLWLKTDLLTADQYCEVATVTSVASIDVVALIGIDGSLLSLSGPYLVRHETNGRWKELSGAVENGESLGFASNIDGKSGDKTQYSLDEVFNGAIAVREHYCSSVLATAVGIKTNFIAASEALGSEGSIAQSDSPFTGKATSPSHDDSTNILEIFFHLFSSALLSMLYNVIVFPLKVASLAITLAFAAILVSIAWLYFADEQKTAQATFYYNQPGIM